LTGTMWKNFINQMGSKRKRNGEVRGRRALSDWYNAQVRMTDKRNPPPAGEGDVPQKQKGGSATLGGPLVGTRGLSPGVLKEGFKRGTGV